MVMATVIAQLVSIALAVALSSVPILTVLVIILEAPRAVVPALFVSGYVTGLLVITALFALGAQAMPDRTHQSNPLAAMLQVTVGIALVVYAAVVGTARRRRTAPREELPSWMRGLGRLKPLPAFGLGLALNARPKSILLAAAAGLAISSLQLTPSTGVVVIAIYLIIGASTVAGPAIFAVLRPVKARFQLESAEKWLLRHSRAVAVIVAIAIGAVVIGNGLTRL